MIMPHIPTCIVLALCMGLSLPTHVRAQGRTPLDSTQTAALMATSLQASKAAAFVLQHATELELNPTQVSAIEALAVAQRDSATERGARLVTRMKAYPPSAAMIAVSSWTGDIDEAELRDALRQQSENQLDLMLGLAWDRRAVAALLSPAQVAQLPRLQAADMMKAIKRP
jgi:hypothetical protein